MGLEFAPDVANTALSSTISDAALEQLVAEWYGASIPIFDAPVITASRSIMGSLASASQLVSLGQASTGLGIHGNSVNSPKPSGYYEVTYKDGTTYHGVGPESRMNTSANKYATPDNPIMNPTYTPTKNRAEAYILEQKGINRTGGVRNSLSSNYNKINSAGKKLLDAIKKIR